MAKRDRSQQNRGGGIGHDPAPSALLNVGNAPQQRTGQYLRNRCSHKSIDKRLNFCEVLVPCHVAFEQQEGCGPFRQHLQVRLGGGIFSQGSCTVDGKAAPSGAAFLCGRMPRFAEFSRAPSTVQAACPCPMPRGASAARPTSAGAAPTVPASPAPFTHSGFLGDGTCR